MQLSRGSTLMVDGVKRKGKSWVDIAPTTMRQLERNEKWHPFDPIERVHFIERGDYLITELRPKRGKKCQTRKPDTSR